MIKLRSFLSPATKLNITLMRFSTNVLKEEKVKLRNWEINYLKVGNGPHNVFCLPGAIGTIWTDFKPQIEGFNREKFTLVAWDPPGYGKSRPPEKEFTKNFYETDAELAQEFMQILNIPRYSILGWSDGGIVGLVMAAKYADRINKLVIWGSNSFILPHELETYKKTRDVKAWSERMRKPMIDIYGDDFQKLWARWCDTMEVIYKEKKGDICSQMLKDIQCPTLILHGEKDPMVDNVHVSHLHTNIAKSRIHLYPEGKHNIHLKYAEDFNTKVQEYLLMP